MKVKRIKARIISVSLLIAILLPQIVQSVWMFGVSAATIPVTIATDYFYKQLDNKNQRTFYEAMRTMLEKGFFKKGNVSIEISGLDTSVGQSVLLDDMGAARDAFMLDYPDLFYVDFDYLSLRGGTDENGKEVIYLGTGRGDSYINKDFLDKNGQVDEAKIDKAIADVNARIESIVNMAKTTSDKERQMRVAYDAVIKAAAYKLEYQASNPYSVRTIYGVFGLGVVDNAGNAVCEGYARALKTILDRLGIPSILVRGYYLSDGVPQEHMWNYVQMGNNWYGMDATFDNTDDTTSVISHKYFYVSDDGMRDHYPTGIISTSNKEFTYPILEGGVSENTNIFTGDNNLVFSDLSGLTVEYVGADDINDHSAKVVYKVSYNGMGYKKAKENGDYIIVDSWQDLKDESTGNINKQHTGWTYPSEIGTYAQIFEDRGDHFLVKMDRASGFKIGVSKIGQRDEEPSEDNAYLVYFEGNEGDVFAMTTEIETGRGTFEYPAPFIKKTTPSINSKQRVGKTYDVTVEYDQKMVYTQDNTEKKVGYEVLLYDRVHGYRVADENTFQFKVTNVKLSDDGTTVTFSFTPSKLWALDDTAYLINFTGIEGELSGKAPNSVGYVLYNHVNGCIFRLMDLGLDLETYGKPMLMDDFDIDDIVDPNSLEDFNIDLQKYGDLLKSRLSLITTETNEAEHAELKDMLDEKLATDGRRLDSSNGKTTVKTYNISLNLCWAQLQALKDGMRIRIMLGFPEGYGPEDAGVTFKAYHYALQDDGSYKIEEIPCTITQYGLIIEVNSFSPFAIAAVRKTSSDKDTKALLISNNNGGKILDASGKLSKKLITMNAGEKATFKAVADDGYIIESLVINGQAIANAQNKTNYTFTATAGSEILATFIAKDTGVVMNIQDDGSDDKTDDDKNQSTDDNKTEDDKQPNVGGNTDNNTSTPAEPSAPDTGIYSRDNTTGSNSDKLLDVINGSVLVVLASIYVIGMTYIIKRKKPF